MFRNLLGQTLPSNATVFIITAKAPTKIAPKACRQDAKKKSQSRKAPPYSAEACQGETKEGKDGKTYKSVQTEIKKGKRKGETYWRWKRVKEEPAAQKKPAREPVKVFDRKIKETDGIAVEETLVGGASTSFKDQVKGAIPQRGGISLQGIKKALNTTPAQNKFVNKALKDGVRSGLFIKNKGKYKLSPRAKTPQKKKKKKKKRTSSSQLQQMKDKQEMKKIRVLSQELFERSYPHKNWRNSSLEVKKKYFVKAFIKPRISNFGKSEVGMISNHFTPTESFFKHLVPSDRVKQIIPEIEKAWRNFTRTLNDSKTSKKKKKRTTSTKKKKLKPGDVITGSQLLRIGEVTQEYRDERGEIFRIEGHLGYYEEHPDIIQYGNYLGPVARGMFSMPRKGFVLWYPYLGTTEEDKYGVNNIFDTYIVSHKTFRNDLNDYYNRLRCLAVKRYGPNDKFTFIKKVSPDDASWRDPEYSKKRVYPRDLFEEDHPGKDLWINSSLEVKQRYFEEAFWQRVKRVDGAATQWRYMNAEAKADHVKEMNRKQRENKKKDAKKKAKKKKEVSPKRPLTAYMLFVHEHQGKSSTEIGPLWRTTSQKEKKKYLTRAQNDRERYRKEMETYVRPKKKKDAKKKSQRKK